MPKIPRLFILLLAGLVLNLIVLASLSFGESRRPFDLISVHESERGFYIGADQILYGKIEIQNVNLFFRVTDGGNARGWMMLDVYNISDEDLSPTFMFILPSDVNVISVGSNATVESRSYGKIIYFPTNIRSYASVYPPPSVEFSWPTFGNSSRNGEWLFFVKGDPYPTNFINEGHAFYQLQQSESNKTIPIKVSVYFAPYQVAELYPGSSAENLLGQGVWNFDDKNQILYEAYGYYADNGGPARQELFKEIALIPLSGLAYGTAERGFRWYRDHSRWQSGKDI